MKIFIKKNSSIHNVLQFAIVLGYSGLNGAIVHSKVSLMCHFNKKSRFNNTRYHQNRLIYMRPISNSAGKCPIQYEISIVCHTWSSFGNGHSQFQSATKKIDDFGTDRNVSHWHHFNWNSFFILFAQFVGKFRVISNDYQPVSA